MAARKTRRISPYADRMGRFIGQLRDHEGITLEQLSRGLCEKSYLNKIENGDREVGKLMTDAFFQRLGKPVEKFERILDHEEFVKWTQRQEMIAHLRSGRAAEAEACAAKYHESCILDRQFTEIVAIDCRALRGAAAEDLLPMVESALRLTQPDFGAIPFDNLLLSQNEGRLLFAHLQLWEKIEGSAAVAEDYRALMRYFQHPRYESRERVYLYPFVACRVVENDYRAGQFEEALSVCEDALAELTREKRLFAYDKLLDWKQKLFDATGNPDRTPGRLLEQLRLMLQRIPERPELLVPCEEQGHVYCLNQVIRDRRNLLGLSQEELSDEACGVRSVSRIENEDGKVQRKNRQKLLKKVNMSGERYDYEIISERYEDYLLRSELDRAYIAKDIERATRFLSILQAKIPGIPTNKQYLLKTEVIIKSLLPANHPDALSNDKQGKTLEEIVNITLPVDFNRIDTWPVSVLSVNEILTLMITALCYKKQEQRKKCLMLLLFIKECIEHTKTSPAYYGDLYIRLIINLAYSLNMEKRFCEAEHILLECSKLLLENQHSYQLARCLCAAAHNIEAQLPCLAEDEREVRKKEAFELLEQAYAMAIISNDHRGRQHIADHCEKVYSKKFNHELQCRNHPKARK